ncbi:MAG: hypothetical protein LBV16_00585 [Elusimicrobiota bacterium]|jgi:hypothetical protein|nr:hypothetical protein [Elusimicrobiota bacterium]
MRTKKQNIKGNNGMTNVKIIIILGIAFLAAACSALRQEPAWIGKTWSEGNYYYFSGISSDGNSLQEAKEQAYMNAVIKAAEFVGMTINNKTTQNLNSNYDNINSQTNLSIQDTFLSQAIIKEFKYTKTNDKKFVGYALIEYKKSILEQEKNRRTDIEAQKQKKIAERKKMGVFTIISNFQNPPLLTSIKKHLQEQGYTISGGGNKIIQVSLIEQRFSISANDIHSCHINVSIEIDGEIQTINSTGYGKDKESAQADAHKRFIAALIN